MLPPCCVASSRSTLGRVGLEYKWSRVRERRARGLTGFRPGPGAQVAISIYTTFISRRGDRLVIDLRYNAPGTHECCNLAGPASFSHPDPVYLFCPSSTLLSHLSAVSNAFICRHLVFLCLSPTTPRLPWSR
ncbi:hypothetical protein LZ32DRAFT_4793 [Colletotrichum eremochloae]|nr:hypothetical protein LZ32DRAFT_4793 [Colletotrichum eremochloae]